MLEGLKRIICICIVAVLFAVIVGCSSNDYMYNNNTINPVKDAVGIYVGDGGGLFSLLEDGSADYFESFYCYPTQGLKWTYSDNRIYIRYADDADVYATAEDLSKDTYYFTSNNPAKWTNETYTRITNDSTHLTREGSLALLKENEHRFDSEKSDVIIERLNSNTITYKDYNFGGLIIQLPSVFEEKAPFMFVSKDGSAGLTFFTYDQGSMSDETFKAYLDDLHEECKSKGLGFVKELKKYKDKTRTVASLQCSENYYSGIMDNLYGKFKIAIINNRVNNQLVMITYSYPDACSGYDELYDPLIESIEVANEEQNLRTLTNSFKSELDYDEIDKLVAEYALPDDWRDNLPFEYDDSYFTSQNIFIYMVNNPVTPDEINDIIMNSDAEGWVSYIYSEDSGRYLNGMRDIDIHDRAGSIIGDFHQNGDSWNMWHLQYLPATGRGLCIYGSENGYSVGDYEHPKHHIDSPHFNTLREALDFIIKYNYERISK